MGAGERGELPKDLHQARNRFQAWRSQQFGRGRIPRELWELAVRLVRLHGLSRTASALRLDYYSLKKHAEADAPEPSAGQPTFVQLPTPVLPAKQALFELDPQTGATLRVQLVGYDPADLEALARFFGNRD
jgi:hypothetical protein